MSENINKKGSKRAALKGFLKKTFGRDSPIDDSASPSTISSVRDASQIDSAAPSPGNNTALLASISPSGRFDTDVAPVRNASVIQSWDSTDIQATREIKTPGGKARIGEPRDLTTNYKTGADIGIHGTPLPSVTIVDPILPDHFSSQARQLVLFTPNVDSMVPKIGASGNTGSPASSTTSPQTHVKSDLEHASTASPALTPRATDLHALEHHGFPHNTSSARARTMQFQPAVSASTTKAMGPHSYPADADLNRGGLIDSPTRYGALPGSRITEVPPSSLRARARDMMTITLEGIATVAQGLYECSDIFLPLKTAAGIFLAIHKIAGKVIENRTALEELEVRLKAILGIVLEYMGHGASEGLKFRAEFFCSAIDHHLGEIRHLSDRSLLRRITEGSRDAEDISRVIKSMNVLCDIFQMDTQLHFGTTVIQKLDSVILKEVYQRNTIYTARSSSYGEVGGCLSGTRVNILNGLTSWAFDPANAKIYWLLGIAGTGKSTIAHSFCEILESYNMLGASFFCSRSSAIASDAGCIIPGIAYQLASSSPAIKTRVVEAIEKAHELVEPTYWSMTKQFSGLISEPIKKSIRSNSGLYKVVVIDALDECSDQEKAANFIKTVLSLIPKIPLKILVVSREDHLISLAFNSAHNALDTFVLHNVEKDIVRDDIRLYLQTALNRIHKIYNPQSQNDWPSSFELSVVLDQCGVLFIYAATLVRYIQAGRRNYPQRLTAILSAGSKTECNIETSPIDDLYTQILEQACSGRDRNEVATIRNVLSAIVFLSVPMSANGLREILNMEVEIALDSLRTVIFVPSDNSSAVTIFHASFADFVTSVDCCMSKTFPALVEETAQEMLLLQCLLLMNKSLKYNICGVPEESISYQTNPQNQGEISEALVYACTHWAIHLTKLSEIKSSVSDALSEFLGTHLLHWFECLSILQKLESSIDMLTITEKSFTKIAIKGVHDNIVSLVRDAKYLIKLCFAVVKDHCFEAYCSMPTWLPKHAYMRTIYAVPKVPQVAIGLPDYWSEVELDIKARYAVAGIAFSPDGRLITGGLENGKVIVWHARTGQVQAQLQSHTDQVLSTAYSSDGKYMASASVDTTVKIWDATTGEILTTLQGHTARVNSVAFSPDSKFVASASDDKTVLIWEVGTVDFQTKLQSHTSKVLSVAYSPDGKFIASGSADKTVKIWDVNTRQNSITLQGHVGPIYSIAYSPDGRFIASGSGDTTIKVWDINTKQALFGLHGHTKIVRSVAYSPDGKLIASGSQDQSVRIWNTGTRAEQAKLVGHSYRIYSVLYSPDGQYIVSGGGDLTVKLWHANAIGTQPQLQIHGGSVWSVVYSSDGRYIVSASSDKTVKVWDTYTGQVEAELEGHTDIVTSVAYSPDGKNIASGSSDKTIIIWDVGNRKIQCTMTGHTDIVLCVAYSPDGRFIASGSSDHTIRIWDVDSRQTQAKLQGHVANVRFIAYSPDGRFIASASNDKTVKIWDVNTRLIHNDLQGHTDEVWSVGYSPDGKFIATVSYDTTIRIWESNTGHLLAVLSGHSDTVRQICFSQNTNILLSFSYDQTIRKWDLNSLVNGQSSSITPDILWDFQSGWLRSESNAYWSPVHLVLCFAIHGNKICVGTRVGKVFDLDFGVDPFTL